MVDATQVATAVLDTVAATAGEIRAGLVGRRGHTAGENPSGERQLEADVWADRRLKERLCAIDGVGQYASEERETLVECGPTPGTGEAVAVSVDPLDGSSNIKSNNAMGTIVGVYDAPLPARGETLIAAAYVLYGPITTMVCADPDGVRELELVDGEQRVVDADVTLPAEPVVYGFGGRVPDWPAEFTAYAREVETELKLRYGGAMIGDVNQVVTYGGIFAYPGLEPRPEGKLRLQFEGNPIGYIIERAGGRSSNGERSLLAVEPDDLHDRTPVHVGNAALIDRLEAALE